MKVLHQLIYEYKKGIRDLFLYTCSATCKDRYEKSLQVHNIPYLVFELEQDKCNIFFGREECLKILESFSSKNLDELTKEEDFILGTMLGYCRNEQYSRYLS